MTKRSGFHPEPHQEALPLGTPPKAVPLEPITKAEPGRAEKAIPLRERLARLWDAHPMPPATGQTADKAFYDELSGEA